MDMTISSSIDWYALVMSLIMSLIIPSALSVSMTPLMASDADELMGMHLFMSAMDDQTCSGHPRVSV